MPVGSDASALTESPSDLLPTGGTTADAAAGAAGTAVLPREHDASTPMFTGEACERGTMEECACEGSDAMGQRMCTANAASPTGGALAACLGCPEASPDAGDAGDACDNGKKDGSESATDCGGDDCDPCSRGKACQEPSDCESGACESDICAAGSGTGGSSATGGMTGGAGGMGGAGGAPPCMCTTLLACCRPDGSCGLGVAPLCL